MRWLLLRRMSPEAAHCGQADRRERRSAFRRAAEVIGRAVRAQSDARDPYLSSTVHLLDRGHVEPAAYSITWSAVTCSAGGTVKPSALAVLWLMTSSNFVGCSTGRSEGLSPLRTRPT